MKRFFIYMFVLLISAATSMAMAQDVVYLKNGSVIKGSVVEINPSKSLKIKTVDGSLFVYNMNEVDRIERENNSTISSNVSSDNDEYLEPGFRGLIEIGPSFGLGDAEKNYQFSMAFTGGYQINRLLFVGAGVAPTLNLFDNEWNDEVETSFLIPIFSAVRVDFLNKKVTPFVNARIGYAINTKDTDFSSMYYYAGVGVRLRKISLGAGADIYSKDGNTTTYAALRFGFEF